MKNQNLAIMETVEPRKLFSGGAVTPVAYLSDSHTLRVNGTDYADNIRVFRNPNNPDRLMVNVNGNVSKFTVSDINKIVISGKAGDDTISLAEYTPIEIPARIMGDAGDDTVIGGTGADSLFGGAGNDLIYGGGGRDRIDDGLGRDTCYGEGGKDYFAHTSPAPLPGQNIKNLDTLIQ